MDYLDEASHFGKGNQSPLLAVYLGNVKHICFRHSSGSWNTNREQIRGGAYFGSHLGGKFLLEKGRCDPPDINHILVVDENTGIRGWCRSEAGSCVHLHIS